MKKLNEFTGAGSIGCIDGPALTLFKAGQPKAKTGGCRKCGKAMKHPLSSTDSVCPECKTIESNAKALVGQLVDEGYSDEDEQLTRDHGQGWADLNKGELSHKSINPVYKPSGTSDGQRAFELRWKEAQASARNRQDWADLHRAISQAMVADGAEEVGSSDLNHVLFQYWNQYQGDWDSFLKDHPVASEEAMCDNCGGSSHHTDECPYSFGANPQ